MAREMLDRRIRHLLDEILILDSMIETATIEAIEALKKRAGMYKELGSYPKAVI